jgi:excisionase family DNA binding protein
MENAVRRIQGRLNEVRKMNEKPFALTIAAACRVSALGRTTLYAALKSGALSARKCGRRTLILAADLEEFLRALPRQNSSGQSTRGDDSR